MIRPSLLTPACQTQARSSGVLATRRERLESAGNERFVQAAIRAPARGNGRARPGVRIVRRRRPDDPVLGALPCRHRSCACFARR